MYFISLIVHNFYNCNLLSHLSFIKKNLKKPEPDTEIFTLKIFLLRVPLNLDLVFSPKLTFKYIWEISLLYEFPTGFLISILRFQFA